MGVESHWWDFSTNPLVLLGAGAFFSGILIPKITRGWQDHQAELTLKTDLVRKISTSIVEITRAVDKEINTPSKSPSEALVKAGDKWHKMCPAIGSDIEAYFYRPRKKYLFYLFWWRKDENTIPDKWSAYIKILDDLNNLPINTAEQKKKFEGWMSEAKKKVYKNSKDIPISPESEAKIKEYKDQKKDIPISIWWEQFMFDVYAMKHKLMQEIIKSNITGFSKFRIW